jgi:hypothetical protein
MRIVEYMLTIIGLNVDNYRIEVLTALHIQFIS